MTKLFAKEKQQQPTRGLTTMRLFTATGGQTQELIIPTNIIIRRCLRFALVANYKVKSIRTFKRYEEHAANMAQRTCLIRAKNITSLKFYFFIWRYIRHKSRRHPSSLTWSTRLHYARRLLLCLQSVLHHTCLRTASESFIRTTRSWSATRALLNKHLCNHYTLLSL